MGEGGVGRHMDEFVPVHRCVHASMSVCLWTRDCVVRVCAHP